MGSVHKTNAAWAVRGTGQDDAYEAYRQGMGGLYAIEGVSQPARRRFYNHSGMTLTPLGVVGWGDSPAQIMARSRRRIGHSAIDGINLAVNLAPMVGDCDGREVRSAAGDVQIRDLTRPSTMRFDRVRVATLMIPRPHVPAALLDADAHGRVLSRHSDAGRILSGHIRLLTRLAPTLSPRHLEAGVRAALVMATRSLGDVRVLPPEDATALRLSLRWRAAQAIEARLTDPGLDVDLIVRLCGGTRATLYRAFEAEGGVGRYIQARRLERAYHHLLSDPGARRIGETAMAHGFASQPHFSRMFRERFGCAPSSVGPDGAITPGTGPLEAPSGAMRHGEAVAWLSALTAAR